VDGPDVVGMLVASDMIGSSCLGLGAGGA
jgi:hypothetical protein